MNREISQGGDRLRDTLSRKQDVRPPLESGAAAKQANGGSQRDDRPVIHGRHRDDPNLQRLINEQGKQRGLDQPAGGTDVIDRSGDQLKQRDIPGGQERFEQRRYPEISNDGQVANANAVLAETARVVRAAAAELAGVLAGER